MVYSGHPYQQSTGSDQSNSYSMNHPSTQQESDRFNHPGPYPLTRGNSSSSDGSSVGNSYHGSSAGTTYTTAQRYLNPLLEVVRQELEDRDRKPVKKRHLTNLPPEEKRQRRLLRNRVAAKECRKKKKLYVEELERRAEILELQNIQLNTELKELNAKLTLGLMRYQVTHSRSSNPSSIQ